MISPTGFLPHLLHHLPPSLAMALLAFFCLSGVSGAELQPSARGEQGVRVLFAGDSLMEKLGPQLQEPLTRHLNWVCLPIGRKSTGLCRPDFYNWPAVLREKLQDFRPHLVVMWVGTNDNQNVYGEKTGGLLTPAWKKAYYRKMLEIITLCQQFHARLILMGPPAVGDARVDEELKHINLLMQRVCHHHRVPYLNVRSILADRQGGYIQHFSNRQGEPVAIRTKDHVHITDAGNNLVIRKLYPLMLNTLNSTTRTQPGATSPSAIRGRKAAAR